MKIDITKPVTTRDGRPVTLITDKAREVLRCDTGSWPQPLAGYIGDGKKLEHWSVDGRYGPPAADPLSSECEGDLVQQNEVWVNIYPGAPGVYVGPDAYHQACTAMRNPIARVRVPYVAGQFDTPSA